MKSKYQILCESLKKSATEYTIIGFPVKTFVKDVAKVFGSSRIKHVIQSKGFQLLGYSNITIHSFFVPEFLFILKQLPRRFRSTYRVLAGPLTNEQAEKIIKKERINALNE